LTWETRSRLSSTSDVPEDYAFAPQTRKEISTIKFFTFDALPKKTWSVMPFMSRLKRWVKAHKSSKKKSSTAATTSTGRAASAPRNRPLTLITNGAVVQQATAVNAGKKTGKDERSVSTPHNDRPAANGSRKANRGHFGTEFETATSYDGLNDETFGAAKKGFSVEEMFSVNERLTGQKFEYDGNPHDFGKPPSRPTATRATAPLFNPKGPKPVQILTRPTSAPLKRVEEETCPSPSPPRQSTGSSPFGSFTFDAVDIMAVVT